ncbi:enhanced serine sensitivity protein SseB C-terminal domain-containing protein [Chitinophaga pinensis]|uniref:Enhanced serine sensitivity protein SseB n=1 Tax=Chitinophaga pinensis TaxID=79329 RepID=A0A5C6LPH1_9BACT|nr:enhanced serine sensitivity protein SseB C-terminal domain-containing protein [Chitinophaga pinensis]TWV99344.1 enhanced serine sensitivity protein SseB [Chitinophaga pinensis]
MKLFDRFRKKPTVDETTVPATSATTPTPLSADRNFVDDLVSYFSSETAVTAAYFGFAYNNTSKAHILVLAIDHQGDEDAIQEITWMIKSQFMQDTEIFYTSSVTNPELTDYIRQHNLPFYHKNILHACNRKS